MKRIPLFSPFSMEAHAELHEILALLEPDETYDIMSRLTAAERRGPLNDFAQGVQQGVRSQFTQAPELLERYSIDDLSAQYRDYMLDLNFDSTFLGIYLDRRDLVADGVIDPGNVDVLDEAVASGRPIVLAPLHLGPVYAALPVLASRIPITTLYHSMPFDQLKAGFFPRADLEAISVPRPNLAVECLGVLAKGRALSMFPEYDPSGPGRRHVSVPFLGTNVLAPPGPAFVAQRAGALIVPFVFLRCGPARYRFEFAEAFTVAPGRESARSAIGRLFRLLERYLLAGTPGAWEIWGAFDRLVADPVAVPQAS